jgi:hypothetical protein
MLRFFDGKATAPPIKRPGLETCINEGALSACRADFDAPAGLGQPQTLAHETKDKDDSAAKTIGLGIDA